jgi:AraC-like DNA-binding protein/mannose-6-phosphate isomerase-like protein (cupin superfamily)
MRKLVSTSRRDAASAVLDSIHFKSTIFCRSKLSAPWGFAVAGRDFATFHVVIKGRCLLEVRGIDEKAWLSAGDVVILPHGHPHVVRDAPTSKATRLEVLIDEATSDGKGVLETGGRGATTVLICGGLHFEARTVNPLFATLPSILHLRAGAHSSTRWLKPVLGFIAQESKTARPGRDAVITRLADIFFIEAVRNFLSGSDADKSRLLLALEEPRIGASLAMVHRRPEADWSVEALARKAGMSRTAFSVRFRELVGEPPLRYVTRCRIDKAVSLLRSSAATIPQIGERVGYGSEAAFYRAFKRCMGKPPAAFRSPPSKKGRAIVNR